MDLPYTILGLQHIQTPHLQVENAAKLPCSMLVLCYPDWPCAWPPQEQSNSPRGAQHHTAQWSEEVSCVPSGN